MIKNRLLTILSALICWLGLSASENLQIVNLFEGDSLAQLSKEQIETLDFAINLLEENDTVVVLPQEINMLMGDTTSICYLGTPSWNLAYFITSTEKITLRIPIYTKTPVYLIESFLYVYRNKNNNIDSYVCTYMPDNSLYKGSTMFSSIQGDFLLGKLYKDNEFICRIEGNTQVEDRTKGPKPRYNSEFKKKKYKDPLENTIYEIRRYKDLDWSCNKNFGQHKQGN